MERPHLNSSNITTTFIQTFNFEMRKQCRTESNLSCGRSHTDFDTKEFAIQINNCTDTEWDPATDGIWNTFI